MLIRGSGLGHRAAKYLGAKLNMVWGLTVNSPDVTVHFMFLNNFVEVSRKVLGKVVLVV